MLILLLVLLFLAPLALSLFLRSKNAQLRTSDFLYICQTSWYLMLWEWELSWGRCWRRKVERSVLFGRGAIDEKTKFDVAFGTCASLSLLLAPRELFSLPLPPELKSVIVSSTRAEEREAPDPHTYGNMQKRSRFSRRIGSVLSSSLRSLEPAAPLEATIAVEGASVCPPEPMVLLIMIEVEGVK